MAEYTKLQKQFMAAVACNTLRGYHVALGWPDEENGITHEAYLTWCEEEYEQFLNTMEDGDTPPAFTQRYSFAEWKEWKREGADDSIVFSSVPCGLCGTYLAGSRHHATLLPDNGPALDGYNAILICEDCLLYVANGDVPDFNEE